ncbi:MAG: oligosaccharide flippase family protein [Clostridia bacterium]|nr:oligosaccharide flippase family protein [Clostridia bacterium]
MKKTLFIKNALVLTVTGLILRLLGIIFKVWLAKRVGSEGIGLYHLVFSVYTFASTFASSGITIAVTRLASAELVGGSNEGLFKMLRRALCITLFIALISFCIILFGNGFIAERFINDRRSAAALSILAFSLPFMGVSAVLKGYFTARRKVSVNSAAVLLEQLVRITLCLYFVDKFAQKGIGAAVAGVILGDTLAEAASCVFSLIFFKADVKKVKAQGGSAAFKGTGELLRIAAPLTAGRYGTTLLRTVENLIMPKALSRAGGHFARSLSIFGALKGMALPVLFFPSSLLGAFSALLIPEMSEALACNRRLSIRRNVERTLRLTLFMGLIFSGVFFFAGPRIGLLIYSDSDSGGIIKALAPLVPLFYLDSISDGILKGLDQQIFTFRNAIIDSALRIVLILIVVPRAGIEGFIYIMYLSNLLTCSLNVGRLIKITGARVRVAVEIIIPTAAAIGICAVLYRLLSKISADLLFVSAYSVLSVILFVGFMVMFKIVDVREYV